VAKQFGKLPKLSIDYALMEKATRVLNIEATFDWDDVGNWTSVGRYLNRGRRRQPAQLRLSQQDASNNIIFAQTGQHVALLGVQDLIVVASKDGLLVADRSKAENIKKIVDGLPPELR
jgi:mannose-1-phosphate guanylyltransferase